MAIIQQPSGPPLGETLLNMFLAKERLNLQKEQVKLQKQDQEMRLREQEAQTAAQQSIIQQIAQEFSQGGGFAQQFVPQNPALSGALSDQTLSEEELRDPRLLGIAAQAVDARRTFEQRQHVEQAMERITAEAARLGDPTLVSRARIALDLKSGGVDDSLIRDLIPPDMADTVNLQAERIRIQGAQDQREADTMATSFLQREGILPEGVDLVPGAAKTLLTVSEARAEDAIDWTQEGIDFITGRIGDSVTGSPFAVNQDGSLSINAAGGGDAVTVEQAIGEWKEFVERYAPEEVRERIIGQVDSNLFERRLRLGQAEGLATDIITSAGNSPETMNDLREILSEDFTDAEITRIISVALQRANRPRP